MQSQGTRRSVKEQGSKSSTVDEWIEHHLFGLKVLVAYFVEGQTIPKRKLGKR